MPLIDFAEVRRYVEEGVAQAGLACSRADIVPTGVAHPRMSEELLVAEYVVADVTRSTPDLLYQIGIRDGARARTTLLVCAEDHDAHLPFDILPSRLVRYPIVGGTIARAEGDALASRVREQLTLAREGKLPTENSLIQVTSWQPSGDVAHSKTDVFLDRLQHDGTTARRITDAVLIKDDDAALVALQEIESQVVRVPAAMDRIHTLLLGLLLGYREKKAYRKMTDLVERFPPELQQTPVVREQLALALNRRAEAVAGGEADELRTQALALLDAIEARSVTSETHAIRGRIYKGWHDALQRSTDKADAARAAAALDQAIASYERGFTADLRDYYPGVNAVTLRMTRGNADDREALRVLLPVVRYAVDAAPAPPSTEERYWQTATKLELAAAERDWAAARRHLQDLLALDVQAWMRETTLRNLRLQDQTLADDAAARARLRECIDALAG